MQFIRPSGQQPSFTKYFLEDPSLLEHVEQKQKKKIVLYDLPQIEPFRKLNKPVVSEQKKRIIKEKLDLQQQSLLQTKQREKRNEFFLNYSENPFIDLSPHTKALRNTLKTQNQPSLTPKQQPKQLNDKQSSQGLHNQPASDHSSGQYIYDIVTELNTVSQKSPKPQFLKMKDDFRLMMKNADLFSNKIIQLSAKKQQFEFFNKKQIENNLLIQSIFEKGFLLASEKNKKLDKDKLESRNRSNTAITQDGKDYKKDPGKTILQQLPQNIMTFDEIIGIREQNYFMKPDPHPQKTLNIFKISFNKNQKQIIGKQLLNKYNFSFTSMVQKLQKIKIPIYRDISRMARRISLGISTGKQDRFDYIDSYELSFKTNSLNFADLMSVASGRFTSEFVYKTTNFDVQQNIIKQTSETASMQQQEQIFYEDNTQNISVRFHNKGQEQQQILNYLKLEYNSRELNYKAQCQQYKQSIYSDLYMKQKLVSTTIQDKQLHGVINSSIKKQLKHFVNLDEKDIEIDRLIRMNMMNKNTNASIKLGKILQAFDIKKKHDEVIRKLGIVQQDDDSLYEDKLTSDKIKLKPRKNNEQNRSAIIANNKNVQQRVSNNNRTPKKPSVNNNINSKTPQKLSTKQIDSRTPQKRSQGYNISKTPQKRVRQNNEQNNCVIKNTIKKPLISGWKH